MGDKDKVPYLKIDRGRYFYQRRVPHGMQAHLGIRRWQIPCGDVSYSKAVQMIVTWAEEHDELIAKLRNPDRLRDAGVAAVREATAKRATEPDFLDLPGFYKMTECLDGEKEYFTREYVELSLALLVQTPKPAALAANCKVMLGLNSLDLQTPCLAVLEARST